MLSLHFVSQHYCLLSTAAHCWLHSLQCQWPLLSAAPPPSLRYNHAKVCKQCKNLGGGARWAGEGKRDPWGEGESSLSNNLQYLVQVDVGGGWAPLPPSGIDKCQTRGGFGSQMKTPLAARQLLWQQPPVRAGRRAAALSPSVTLKPTGRWRVDRLVESWLPIPLAHAEMDWFR